MGRPGGYYIGTDGKPHDAWGKPIGEEVEPPVSTETVQLEPETAELKPEPEVLPGEEAPVSGEGVASSRPLATTKRKGKGK